MSGSVGEVASLFDAANASVCRKHRHGLRQEQAITILSVEARHQRTILRGHRHTAKRQRITIVGLIPVGGKTTTALTRHLRLGKTSTLRLHRTEGMPLHQPPWLLRPGSLGTRRMRQRHTVACQRRPQQMMALGMTRTASRTVGLDRLCCVSSITALVLQR